MPDEKFESAKAASTAQVLFKTARLLNEHAVGRVRERARLPNLRPSHTALFPHIRVDGGSRLTELAAALGVSKQAVAQLVDELVDMRVLTRLPDPDDGRAKRIAYSRGVDSLMDGLSLLGEVEAEIADAIGEDTMGDLHRGLTALLTYLEGR
ncbi:MAG: helix-turn-helix domain-containing protein [Myxococcota bacterium]